MTRDEQQPTLDEYGSEAHPAFAMVNVNRVSHSPPGASLFDSEVRHQHYVVLRIARATRRRDLNRDWIHGETTPVIEVAMSEAQWAQMVSSTNSSGTPVTLTYVDGEPVPRLPYAPRMERSLDEVRGAARRVFDDVQAAFAKVQEKPTKANLRTLEAALRNAEPNVTFAAKSLAKHTEDTVQRAKADIEAMVDHRARQLGLDPHQLTVALDGQDAPKEVES